MLVGFPAMVMVAALSSASASGCSGKDPYRPGDSVGAFSVAGKLLSTTCGATPDPWAFDVMLRHDHNTIYWVQGDAPVSGLVDTSAHTILTFTDTSTVRDADPKTMTAACTMSRTDTVDIILAPITAAMSATGDPTGATSFGGTLTYQFTVASGASCDDQLTESGGDYATLPCTVSYQLTGTRTGDAK